MRPEDEAILLEAARRMADLDRQEPPPAWRIWDRQPFDEQRENGPEYRPFDWFGPHSEAERVRYLRAIRRLETAGLLVTHQRLGRRLSHVKLSPLGQEIAQRLIEGRDVASGARIEV